jgi:hypothetical protein
MQAVLRVDAAPGFEESVEAQLKYTQGVKRVAFEKHDNYDFLVLVDVTDAAELQRMVHSRIRLLSGVKGVEHLKEPTSEQLAKLH